MFVLTDEQILEIADGGPGAPAQGVTLSHPAAANEAKNLSSAGPSDGQQSKRDSSSPSAPQNDSALRGLARGGESTSAASDTAQPPKWLADMMADPQAGAEARDLWSGIQQARQEAAAFREVFAKPEEARAAAQRSRALEEIDAAFYGGTGKPPEEASAARAALAQRLLREHPAAFREMVFAGLRALEEASVVPPFRAASVESFPGPRPGDAGLKPGPAQVSGQQYQEHEVQIAAYRTFEKAANGELERSVGGAIDRAVARALPNITNFNTPGQPGPQPGAPLQARLQAAIREDVEAALKADRQLGEQVAQVLSSRRFDEDARAQVVRLINDRAQQLVPAAAKRVINDWTQATLAARGAKTRTAENSVTRADLPSVDVSAASPRFPAGQTRQTPAPVDAGQGRRNADATRAARLDYRKLSDEQILEL